MGLEALLDDCVRPAQRRALFVRLVKLSKSSDKKTSIEATKLLLSYLYGTPRQSISLEGGSSPVIVQVVYDEEPTPNSSTPAPAPGTDDDPPAGEEV